MTKLRKLNRPTGHRLSMLRTMVSQLVKHERIETTVARAKEVRRLADNMVQLGKDGTLCAARRAAGFVRGDDVLHKLFTELAYRYKDRAGGYTRLLRTRIRVGDAAPMAYIEFIDRENELRQSKPPTPQLPQRPAMDPWTKSWLSRQFAPPTLRIEIRYPLNLMEIFVQSAIWNAEFVIFNEPLHNRGIE